VVGVVVDRFDSRVLLAVSSLWQAGGCLLLAFADDPRVALPLVALNACGTAVTNPLFIALTSVMVPGGQLAVANSVQQGAVTIAMMAGPAAAGLLMATTGGARVPLLLDAVLFVVIAGAGALIGTRRRPEPPAERPHPHDGIVLLFNDNALAAVVGLAVLLTLVVHFIYGAQVFLVRGTFGASALAFGLLQATHMSGLLVGTVVASRLNTVRRIVLGAPLAATAMSVAIAAIGLAHSLPATFVLYVLAGVCMSVVSVSVGTILLLRVPEPVIGLATASFTAVHRTAGLIAYGLGGLVVGLLRPELVYLLSGIGALVVVLLLAPAFRKALAQA
jgi:MFS family permease